MSHKTIIKSRVAGGAALVMVYVAIDKNHVCWGSDEFRGAPEITFSCTGSNWNRNNLNPKDQVDPDSWVMGVATNSIHDIGKDPFEVAFVKASRLLEALSSYDNFQKEMDNV